MERKRSVYFHTNLESESNIARYDVPLVMNAVGVEYFYRPFRYTDYRYDYSVVYVVEGTLDLWLGETYLQINQGEFILTMPDLSTASGTSCKNLHYFWLNFTGSAVCKMLDTMHLQVGKVYQVGVYEEIRNCYRKMAGEFSRNDELFSEVSVAIFTELMAFLSRKVNVKDKGFQKSVAYIELHYNEQIDAEKLAMLEGLSVSHYRMLFKKKFNIPPNAYITMKRINAACFHLRHSECSVEEIAQLVGYSDSFYFSRIFKKKTGSSPSEYRQIKE